MLPALLPFLVCPVTGSELNSEIYRYSTKTYNGRAKEIILEGILYSSDDWFYPIIGGIPRLQVEAFLDHAAFLHEKMPGFENKKQILLDKYGELISRVIKKNKKTKESFALEWSLFDYNTDKTWELKGEDLLKRFLEETDESIQSLSGKIIFDAGCGNGQLNQYIARSGARVIGMDFSKSIERAFSQNTEENAFFIQGDVQYPPLRPGQFNIVHSSGVLICTHDTAYSFSCIEPCVKPGGKMSVWLYHPRKNIIHNLFNFIRRYTSRLPIKWQYYLYRVTIFPVSFIVKRLKGNKQNSREMMISIMDWFSPEFRWEHTPDEAKKWFVKSNYRDIKVTTTDIFGFNMTGVKNG